MPVTIKTSTMKYKKQDGTYKDFNAVVFPQTEDIEFEIGKSIIIKSENGTAYKISVGNDGTLSANVLT